MYPDRPICDQNLASYKVTVPTLIEQARLHFFSDHTRTQSVGKDQMGPCSRVILVAPAGVILHSTASVRGGSSFASIGPRLNLPKSQSS